MDPVTFARLFDAQYADYKEDLPFWLHLAATYGDPILELGCGPGRVLRALLSQGYRAEGLDQDPAMLARARRHLAEQVRLHQADLATFRLGETYALILIPCNTLAYLPHDRARQAFHTARRHLRPGGALAFELPNPADAVPEETDEELLDAFLDPETGHAVQVYARTERAAPQTAQVEWLYDELLPEGEVRRHARRVTYHLWEPGNLEQALRQASYRQVAFFGDYDRTPFAPDSPRLLVVAQVDTEAGM